VSTAVTVERLSESEFALRWGVQVSRYGMTLANITADEAIHLQRFPLVNGPAPALTKQLWRKLADSENWQIVERPAAPLDIEVHSGVPDIAALSIGLVPENASRILIAGSMEGHEAELLRSARPDRVYHLLDLLPEHVAKLRQRGFVACAMDLHRLAYAPKSFDAVYNNNVMEHVYNDVDECFAKVREILKPGGIFVFVVPTETNATNPDSEWQRRRVGRAHDWWLVDPAHPWKTDLHDIQARLVGTAFDVPTFVYFAENLRHCVDRARARTASSWWVWPEGLCRLIGGSLWLQRMEARIRAATGCYRYLGVRRWLRYRLRLPNRQTDTLQVAVIARRSE
jgi:SAM-dependent methyltransferase